MENQIKGVIPGSGEDEIYILSTLVLSQLHGTGTEGPGLSKFMSLQIIVGADGPRVPKSATDIIASKWS